MAQQGKVMKLLFLGRSTRSHDNSVEHSTGIVSKGQDDVPVFRRLKRGESVSATDSNAQFLGLICQAIHDGMSVLSLWKDTFIFLYHDGYAMRFKPTNRIFMVKGLH